jgi:hypothetical protein
LLSFVILLKPTENSLERKRTVWGELEFGYKWRKNLGTKAGEFRIKRGAKT